MDEYRKGEDASNIANKQGNQNVLVGPANNIGGERSKE